MSSLDKESFTALSATFGDVAERFYQQPRWIALSVLMVLASGISSLWVLPRMEDPLLTQRAANVTTVLPGADAERVEALITEPIEERLLDLPEIKRLRSQSRAGVSFVAIELRDEITKPDPVWSKVRSKLDDCLGDLPAGASRPLLEEAEITAYAWIGALVWAGDTPPALSVLRRVARDLKDEFLAVAGTKKVDLFGDPGEQILVDVDPDRSNAAGLSAAAVAQQLALHDVRNAAGTIRDGRYETIIELGNKFDSLADILQAPLQASEPGKLLRLSDVATVSRAIPDPPTTRALADGRLAVVVAVLLRPEHRIDHWAAAADTVLDRFQRRLPPEVSLDVIMQQEVYVRERMQSLAQNMLLGVSGVALMTLFFLGWRSALLVTATLPLAALMVLGGMRACGIPIHQMSVTGLVIALGLMIDNAIIATDELAISRQRGFTGGTAIRDMVRRLFAPLLASTITTALAFAPIALMEGPAGEFVGSIAMTVVMAIFSSLLLSMTLLPAVATLLHDRGSRRQERARLTESRGDRAYHWGVWQHGIQSSHVTHWYRRMLTFLLVRPWRGVALGCLLPILGFLAATQLEEQFFPPTDRDQIYLEMELSPQASLAETQRLSAEVDRVLTAHPRIRHTTWFLGESAPPFYYNIIARRKNSPQFGQAILTLDDHQQTLPLIRELQAQLDDRFPQARVLVRQLEQGPPFDAPVELRLIGSDLETLQQWGERLRGLVVHLPNIVHVRTALSEIRPSVSMQIDAAKASWTGLSEAEIAEQLFARLEGLPAGSIIEQVEQIPVRVRIAASDREAVESLQHALVWTRAAQGESRGAVPIGSVATVQLTPQRAVITRYNGRRVNEVQGFLDAGTLPSRVLKAFQDQFQSTGLELPVGYSLEYGGEASERNDAVARLMANVSVLAVGMLGAMVLALASFRLAALIGLVASLSVGLGLGALWLFGYPFGFMAIIGTMGLIGIAINDSIVVTSALYHQPSVRHGDLAATVEVVMEVTRHVLATTATTMIGFLPLLLGGGGFWPPLAVSIGAGVVGATLLSLTLVPAAIRGMAMRADKSLKLSSNQTKTHAAHEASCIKPPSKLAILHQP